MKKFFLIIYIFFSCFSFAQSDFDINQHQAYELFIAYEQEKAKELIESKFLKSKNISLQIIGYIHLAQYYEYTDLENNKKQLECLEKAKSLAQITNIDLDKAYVNYGFAMYYKSLSRWDLYIKHFWESVNYFKNYPNENFNLAKLYISKYKVSRQNPLDETEIEGYEKAIDYAIKSKNKAILSTIYLDIGTYYVVKKNDIAKAKSYYEKSYKLSQTIQNKATSKALSFYYFSNIGAYYTSTKEFDKALEFLNKGLNQISNEDYFYLCSFYNNIGAVYAALGDYTNAIRYYLKADQFSNDKNISNIQRIQIKTNISNTYEKLNQLDKAIDYLKIAKDITRDEGQRRYNYNAQSLENFYRTEEKNILLAEENTRYENQKKYLIGIILLTFFSTVVLIYMLYYKQKLNKQKTKFLESEKEKLKIEKELSELKQEHYQKQVLAASIQLEQKKKFLEDLNKNITNNKDFNLTSYLKGEHFVDKNLSNIHDIIKEVHPNFFKKLQKISINKLTNLDIKYAAYIYMNMDNSQIASILNVDPKTVSVTKYRLKQKLGLSKEIDLESFLKNLE